MKKLLLVAAVAVFGLTGVNAQDMSFGAKAGLNLASLGGDVPDDMSGKMGFHLGLVAEIMFTEEFGFQPEILYSTQGAKMEMSETFMGTTVEVKENTSLSYVNVPLLGKYYVTESLNIQLGPQIGFLVNAEAEYEENMDGETDSETVDIKDSLKGLDLGVAGGLGYKMDMGLFFNARYALGFSNIYDVEGEDMKVTNNVFQFSVGYFF